MVQAKNGSIIATIIVCAVLIAGFVYLTMPETPVVNVPVVSVPTAAEIAALVKIPEIPAATAAEVDTTMIDRLCELTDGCEFYEIDYDITHNPETINPIDGGIAENVVLSKTSGSDFDKAIEKLIDEENK